MERKEEINQAAHKVYPYIGGTKEYICENSIPIFIQGAEWADETMINKAIKYLSKLTKCAVSCIGEDVYVPILSKEQLEDFKKAMKN